MGILEAFDDKSEAIIKPKLIYEKNTISDKCIVTFSNAVYEKVINEYKYKVVSQAFTANGPIDILLLEELDVLFYMSPIGAAVAGTILEEVAYLTSASKFIFFGSCGLLEESVKDKIIVPSHAYREEGISYHYALPSDYISIKNYKTVEAILKENNIPYVVGKTWTTDAIYMETVNKANKRRSEGCVSVEMEAAGLEAVCDYLNIDLYIFFFTGDILNERWDIADLSNEKEKHKQINAFDIALLIAKS